MDVVGLSTAPSRNIASGQGQGNVIEDKQEPLNSKRHSGAGGTSAALLVEKQRGSFEEGRPGDLRSPSASRHTPGAKASAARVAKRRSEASGLSGSDLPSHFQGRQRKSFQSSLREDAYSLRQRTKSREKLKDPAAVDADKKAPPTPTLSAARVALQPRPASRATTAERNALQGSPITPPASVAHCVFTRAIYSMARRILSEKASVPEQEGRAQQHHWEALSAIKSSVRKVLLSYSVERTWVHEVHRRARLHAELEREEAAQALRERWVELLRSASDPDDDDLPPPVETSVVVQKLREELGDIESIPSKAAAVLNALKEADSSLQLLCETCADHLDRSEEPADAITQRKMEADKKVEEFHNVSQSLKAAFRKSLASLSGSPSPRSLASSAGGVSSPLSAATLILSPPRSQHRGRRGSTQRVRFGTIDSRSTRGAFLSTVSTQSMDLQYADSRHDRMDSDYGGLGHQTTDGSLASRSVGSYTHGALTAESSESSGHHIGSDESAAAAAASGTALGSGIQASTMIDNYGGEALSREDACDSEGVLSDAPGLEQQRQHSGRSRQTSAAHERHVDEAASKVLQSLYTKLQGDKHDVPAGPIRDADAPVSDELDPRCSGTMAEIPEEASADECQSQRATIDETVDETAAWSAFLQDCEEVFCEQPAEMLASFQDGIAAVHRSLPAMLDTLVATHATESRPTSVEGGRRKLPTLIDLAKSSQKVISVSKAMGPPPSQESLCESSGVIDPESWPFASIASEESVSEDIPAASSSDGFAKIDPALRLQLSRGAFGLTAASEERTTTAPTRTWSSVASEASLSRSFSGCTTAAQGGGFGEMEHHHGVPDQLPQNQRPSLGMVPIHEVPDHRHTREAPGPSGKASTVGGQQPARHRSSLKLPPMWMPWPPPSAQPLDATIGPAEALLAATAAAELSACPPAMLGTAHPGAEDDSREGTAATTRPGSRATRAPTPVTLSCASGGDFGLRSMSLSAVTTGTSTDLVIPPTRSSESRQRSVQLPQLTMPDPAAVPWSVATATPRPTGASLEEVLDDRDRRSSWLSPSSSAADALKGKFSTVPKVSKCQSTWTIRPFGRAHYAGGHAPPIGKAFSELDYMTQLRPARSLMLFQNQRFSAVHRVKDEMPMRSSSTSTVVSWDGAISRTSSGVVWW